MSGPRRGRVDRDSGVDVAPECGQSWNDVGGFDRDKKCIVGGDQGKADREELAGGGTKTTGVEVTDTEVPVPEVAPRPDPGRQYAGWIDGRRQVRWSGGGSRAATLWAGSC